MSGVRHEDFGNLTHLCLASSEKTARLARREQISCGFCARPALRFTRNMCAIRAQASQTPSWSQIASVTSPIGEIR